MARLVDIDVQGLDADERAIRQLAAQLLDLRTFWPKLVPLFIGWVSATFDSEGAFIGDPWAELSEPYGSWKQVHYPGKRLLSREGYLRRAATSPTRKVTPRVLELTISEYQVETGELVSPSWFQEGTEDMPPRPLLAEEPTLAMQEQARQVGEQHAHELVRMLGLR